MPVADLETPMQSQSTSARRPAPRPDLGRVRALVEPVLLAHGVELVDVEWTGGHGGAILRVTIERLEPSGRGASGAGALAAPGGVVDAGVTLADCADISRDLSAVLDVEDFISQHYALEVSSPGLERPLRSRRDFERFVGQPAWVKLSRPAPDGQRVLRGTIEPAEGDLVGLRVDGRHVVVPYADVREAHLLFELAAAPKPGGKKRPGVKRSVAGRDEPSARALGDGEAGGRAKGRGTGR